MDMVKSHINKNLCQDKLYKWKTIVTLQAGFVELS